MVVRSAPVVPEKGDRVAEGRHLEERSLVREPRCACPSLSPIDRPKDELLPREVGELESWDEREPHCDGVMGGVKLFGAARGIEACGFDGKDEVLVESGIGGEGNTGVVGEGKFREVERLGIGPSSVETVCKGHPILEMGAMASTLMVIFRKGVFDRDEMKAVVLKDWRAVP